MKMTMVNLKMFAKPPVPVEGPDEAKVEAVVVSQLATDCSSLKIKRGSTIESGGFSHNL